MKFHSGRNRVSGSSILIFFLESPSMLFLLLPTPETLILNKFHENKYLVTIYENISKINMHWSEYLTCVKFAPDYVRLPPDQSQYFETYLQRFDQQCGQLHAREYPPTYAKILRIAWSEPPLTTALACTDWRAPALCYSSRIHFPACAAAYTATIVYINIAFH